ncbi:MAG TPA: type II secretion system protein [Mycobacteriales bacterium]|nr:type II secretion system protein [Mycobacteriales bacterium]
MRRRTRAGQGGFTLIEVIVALSLVSIAAAGSVPLLITGLRSAVTSRLNTQAKNLAQQRFESMRDLEFHVDRQNGPFVDLLDIYYTNLTTTATTRTRANEIEVGKWISSGASAPNPSGPFYQVSVAQLPGNPSFSQTIDTQFLTVSGQPIAASTFTGYDSQTEGHDQPPSSMVGVTVVTTWTDHGVSHSYTSYTRIADGRGLTSALSSQADGEFLRVSSTGSAGNALTVDVASAEANGSLSTGSIASADVKAVEADDATGQDYLVGGYVANTATGTNPGAGPFQASGFAAGTDGDCGWVGAGLSQATNVSAAISNSLPQVPSNVDTNSPPNNQATSQLMTTGGNGPCGIFGFSNQSTSYDPNLMLTTTNPLVQIANDGGVSVAAGASAWVNATSAVTAPHSVTSGANASANNTVRLFPNASFTGGAGLVEFQLNQASLSCSATSNAGSVTNAASGSWSVTVKYWKASNTTGGGSMVTLGTYTWNSATGSGSADPLASFNPSTVVVYQNGSTVLHLSDYIASWNTARSIVENPGSGLHQLSGIVSVTTTPVRAGDIISAVGLQLGNLSCAADDER